LIKQIQAQFGQSVQKNSIHEQDERWQIKVSTLFVGKTRKHTKTAIKNHFFEQQHQKFIDRKKGEDTPIPPPRLRLRLRRARECKFETTEKDAR